MDTPDFMDHATVRRLVLDALRDVGEAQVPDAGDLQAGDLAMLRRVPAWVRRVGLVRAAGTWWLYVERQRRRRREGFDPGQVVLDLPAGRYAVETLDVGGRAWVGLETAAGGPLVVGLTCPARTVVLRIQWIPGLSE